MRRSPSSSFLATASTSIGGRDSHLSLSSPQRRACSNVPQITTIPPCEEGKILGHICINFLVQSFHTSCL
jgi:hypothetical protein